MILKMLFAEKNVEGMAKGVENCLDRETESRLAGFCICPSDDVRFSPLRQVSQQQHLLLHRFGPRDQATGRPFLLATVSFGLKAMRSPKAARQFQRVLPPFAPDFDTSSRAAGLLQTRFRDVTAYLAPYFPPCNCLSKEKADARGNRVARQGEFYGRDHADGCEGRRGASRSRRRSRTDTISNRRIRCFRKGPRNGPTTPPSPFS